MARQGLTEEEIQTQLFDDNDIGSDAEEPIDFVIEADEVFEDFEEALASVEGEEIVTSTALEDVTDPHGSAASPEPRGSSAASPVPQPFSPSEIRSRKRKRGLLQPADGAAIKKIEHQIVRAKDKTVWHSDPKPNMPSITRCEIEEGGPTEIASGKELPEEVFSIFLQDSVLASICLHTNDKMECLRQEFHRPAHATFSDLGIMELKALLGILIMSGVRKDNHLSTEEMWSHVYGCPFYKSTMSERRFAFLLRCLRFDDSATRKTRLKTDRFAHVRHVWDHVIRQSIFAYKPGPHITVDEQLLAFRGHCIFRMFIPNKPAK